MSNTLDVRDRFQTNHQPTLVLQTAHVIANLKLELLLAHAIAQGVPASRGKTQAAFFPQFHAKLDEDNATVADYPLV